jgi:hypothetical protein
MRLEGSFVRFSNSKWGRLLIALSAGVIAAATTNSVLAGPVDELNPPPPPPWADPSVPMPELLPLYGENGEVIGHVNPEIYVDESGLLGDELIVQELSEPDPLINSDVPLRIEVKGLQTPPEASTDWINFQCKAEVTGRPVEWTEITHCQANGENGPYFGVAGLRTPGNEATAISSAVPPGLYGEIYEICVSAYSRLVSGDFLHMSRCTPPGAGPVPEP